MTDEQKILHILNRREYFDSNFPVIEGCDARQDISYRLSNSCPSCGYLTLDKRCSWKICIFCFWEDDGQDNADAHEIWGGPNSDYSLTAHRIEVFDWMNDLKSNWETANSTEKSLGLELTKLDDFISKNESNKQLVLNQIKLLSNLFSKCRNFEFDNRPFWKFLTEKQVTKVKPAYNNVMPKAGRSWWQKLFGKE